MIQATIFGPRGKHIADVSLHAVPNVGDTLWLQWRGKPQTDHEVTNIAHWIGTAAEYHRLAIYTKPVA